MKGQVPHVCTRTSARRSFNPRDVPKPTRFAKQALGIGSDRTARFGEEREIQRASAAGARLCAIHIDFGTVDIGHRRAVRIRARRDRQSQAREVEVVVGASQTRMRVVGGVIIFQIAREAKRTRAGKCAGKTIRRYAGLPVESDDRGVGTRNLIAAQCDEVVIRAYAGSGTFTPIGENRAPSDGVR